MSTKMRKVLTVIIALLMILSVIPASISHANEQADTNELTVEFLDVGQGLSVLFESGGQTMIYDGGNRNHSSYVVSYLQNKGIEDIDYMIASHWDEDHIAGLVGCLNAFQVNNVIGPDYTHDSKIYNSFMSGVESQGLSVQHPAPGDMFSLGSATVTILSPVSITEDSNNNSVAVKVQNGDNTFILTGDAEYQEESDIINTGISLDCDVLCLGHHGSASSSSYDFLAKTTPEYAVISCGENNSYGHPHEETMEKLQAMDTKLFRTDKQGEIIAVSDGTTITWNVSPTDDFSDGDGDISDIGYEEPSSECHEFVINTNTGKFHIPSCSSVSKMSKKNKLTYTGTKEDLISQGYMPCKNCIG